MRIPIGPQFTSSRNVTAICGIVCAYIMIGSVLAPRNSWQALATDPLLGTLTILLVPCIATRSWSRAGVAVVLMALAGPLALLPTSGMNGRDDLPMTVWWFPANAISTPGGDGRDIPWQVRACFVVGRYWLVVGAILLVIVQPTSASLKSRIPAMGLSLLLAVGFALALYMLSWRAMLSGTFRRPLYIEWEFWFSMVVYGTMFSATPWVLITLHDKFAVRLSRFFPAPITHASTSFR